MHSFFPVIQGNQFLHYFNANSMHYFCQNSLHYLHYFELLSNRKFTIRIQTTVESWELDGQHLDKPV